MLTFLCAFITWLPMSLLLIAITPPHLQGAVTFPLTFMGFWFWWGGWYFLVHIVRDVCGLHAAPQPPVPTTRYPLARRAANRP